MKYWAALVLVLGFLPWPAWPQSRPAALPTAAPTPVDQGDDEEGDEGYFFLGASALVVLPTQSQALAYQAGGGAGISGGYDFGDGVALQLQVQDLYFYGPNATSIYSLRPLAELKLYLDLDDFEPYVLLGGGANIHFIDYNNATSASSVNPASVFGLGGQLLVADDLMLYVESKYTVTYYDQAKVLNGEITQDIPLEAGLLWAP